MSETVTGAKSLHIPTLAEVLRRRSELLAHAASQPGPEPIEDFLEDPAMDFTDQNLVDDFVDNPVEEPAPPAPPRTPPWPILAATAYHGIAGRVVRAIAPHTEADPAAIRSPGRSPRRGPDRSYQKQSGGGSRKPVVLDASGANLKGVTNPVAVTLSIGINTGTTSVTTGH